ncbi:MAG TPA: universal stress protein, partial [Candidatus Methylomirabilis sp.]|nr:universal stress protein [Candidatus Methylomirabilis sp.]
TAPAATHLLARAAYMCDYPLAVATAVDELGEYLAPPTGTELLALTEREESKMLTRILVGLDNTPNTDAAVRQAIEVAQRHRAQLTGLVVEDVRALENVGPIPIGGSYYAKRLREHRRTQSHTQCEGAVARFEAACQGARIRYEVKRITGDPFETFAAQGRYHDMVILSVQFQFYHGVIEEPRNPLGRLMKRGMRPVIAVAPDAQSIRQVIIAYNGSIESTMAMKQFLQLSPWPEISARLVWCGEESADAQELLDQARAYCRSHGLAVEVDLKAASRREELLDYATDRKADLIVIGTGGSHFPGAVFLADSGVGGTEGSKVSLFLNQ